jgi:hypothetical protein
MEINVKGESYNCPFRSTEDHQIGDMSWDTEVKCSLKKSGECYGSCPLSGSGTVTVHWNKE